MTKPSQRAVDKPLGNARRQHRISAEQVVRLRSQAPAGLLAARVAVGGIFLIAGLTKVGSPGLFADAVRAYHLLPPSLVLPIALILPWMELLVAAYLLLGFMTRLGAAGAAILLGSFIYALASSLATGNTAHSCGCFGPGAAGNPLVAFLTGGNTVTWWDVVRDVLLLGLSLLILIRGAGALSVEGLLRRGRQM